MHLAKGTRPSGRDRCWTYEEFAEKTQSSREEDEPISERSPSNWARGYNLPSSIEPILSTFFDLTRADQAEAREELHLAYDAAVSESRAEQQQNRAKHAILPEVRPDGIHVFGTNSEHPRFSDDVAPCYDALFPVDEERDQFENIVSWLDKAHKRTQYKKKHEWVHLFFTYRKRGKCIGIAFLSLYEPNPERGKRKTGWWFGAYFGILHEARKKGAARKFLTAIIGECQRVVPDAKGIVFEVERYIDGDIASALEKLNQEQTDGTPFELTKAEKYSIRAARRIALYTKRGAADTSLEEEPGEVFDPALGVPALSVVTRDATGKGLRFLDYIQPAMLEPLGDTTEVPLWLMVYPLRGLAIDIQHGFRHQLTPDEVQDLFSFLYDEVFPSAFAGDHGSGQSEDTKIDGYEEYIAEFRERVLPELLGKEIYLVKQCMLSEAARRLICRFPERLAELKLDI